MRDPVELSAVLQRVMRDKKLSPAELGEKAWCRRDHAKQDYVGDVVPSGHLEKQRIELLGMEPDQVKNLTARRQKRSTAAMKRRIKKRKAA